MWKNSPPGQNFRLSCSQFKVYDKALTVYLQSMSSCPLCESSQPALYQTAPFLRCPQCRLIFKEPQVRLSAALEKQRYSFHQNHLEDKNYVHFLQPAVQAVKKFSAPGSRGLDYGCGPQPVLAELLRQVGYRVSAYDPFFYPLDLGEIMPLDFITCTEAAEHFFNPGQEFKRIFSLLKPEGSLILMTGLYRENLKIQDWHYGRDPTHVVFFCEATLQWIAHQFQRSCQLTFPNLAVF